MSLTQIIVGIFVLVATGWGFALLKGTAVIVDWIRRRFTH